MPTTNEQFLTSLLAGQGLSGEAAQAALEALPARGEGKGPAEPPRPPAGRPSAASGPNRRARRFSVRLAARREKLFGLGRPVPLSREAKKRIEARVVALTAKTQKGKAWGEVTPKIQEIALALLWKFHNAGAGVCIPSYETVAATVGCSTNTVRRALAALQAAGVLTWTNRLKRVWDGARQRVLRSSNSYAFIDPGPADSSKGDKRAGTVFQAFFSPFRAAFGGERTARSGRKEVFEREGWRDPLPDGVF
jgi:Helix-turn-helix domain